MSANPTDPTDVPRCVAMAKGTGERCKRRPVPGGTVCVKHGGGAPAVRAAAARRVQQAAADKLLAGLLWNPDAEPVTDAVSEMQRLAGSMRHAADFLGNRLNGSGDKCAECGRGDSLDEITGIAFLRLLRELRQLLADMERLGIAGRHVELEADRVRLIALAVGRMFDVLGLGEEQRVAATQVLLAELRADDDGAVPVGEVEA